MDRPTSRVQHGVFTTPVRLDSDLVPDDVRRLAQHRVEAPRRVMHPGRALRRFILAIAASLTTPWSRRTRRPMPPVVAVKDRAPM